MRCLLIFLFAFMCGCENTLKPAPVEEKINLKWGDSHPDWTAHLLQSLETSGADLLKAEPTDYKTWCGVLSKKTCYAQLISMMAFKESNHKPTAIYIECSSKKGTYKSEVYIKAREPKPYCIPGHKLDGGVAISRGLMQISIQSAQSYGCKITEPKQLNDPFNNLECAVKILNRWIPKDKRIAGEAKNHLGAGRYWSVMRIGSGSYPEVKKYMTGL